jgi:hypothetical protein
MKGITQKGRDGDTATQEQISNAITPCMSPQIQIPYFHYRINGIKKPGTGDRE